MKVRKLRIRQAAKVMHPVCQYSAREKFLFPFALRGSVINEFTWEKAHHRLSKRQAKKVTSFRITVHTRKF